MVDPTNIRVISRLKLQRQYLAKFATGYGYVANDSKLLSLALLYISNRGAGRLSTRTCKLQRNQFRFAYKPLSLCITYRVYNAVVTSILNKNKVKAYLYSRESRGSTVVRTGVWLLPPSDGIQTDTTSKRKLTQSGTQCLQMSKRASCFLYR